MNTTIQKWGNSKGLRLRKEILDTLNLSEGDSVKVSIRSGDIIISPDKKRREVVDLKRLFLRKAKRNDMKEFDWGAPVGKEIW